MHLKIHFLHSLMSIFPENVEDVSDERGEEFYENTASDTKDNEALLC